MLSYSSSVINSVIINDNLYKSNRYISTVAHFIINFIYCHSVINYQSGTKWICISTRYIHNFVSHKLYYQAIKLLMENGIIERDNKFVVGHKTKRYRLTPKFSKLHKIDRASYLPLNKRNHKTTCFDRYEKHLHNKVKINHNTDDNCKKTLDFIKMLDIDLSKIQKEVDKLPTKSIIKKENQARRDRKTSYQYYLDCLSSPQTYYAFKKSETGRMYTLHGNCPRSFRQHFTYRGEKMVEIDFHQSQPTCLLKLYDENIEAESSESARYRKFLQEKDFYTYFNEKSEKPVVGPREKIKESIYIYLMFGGLRFQNHPIVQAFKEEFPILWSKMATLKAKSKRALSDALQEIEAKIFLDIIFNKIEKHFGELVGFSIHDSFLVRESCAKEVQSIIRATLQEEFNFPVQVRMK